MYKPHLESETEVVQTNPNTDECHEIQSHIDQTDQLLHLLLIKVGNIKLEIEYQNSQLK